MGNAKDERYIAVRRLIENEDIQRFSQCFKVVPKSTIASDLGEHQGRFGATLENVERLTVNDIFRISELFDVDDQKVYKLISNQYKESKQQKSQIKPHNKL